MAENRKRRGARRQQRGLLRAEELLRVAGALFAEVGYDRATTNLLAERAGVSPGSLYQFFPHKEAIARAYAAEAVADLHRVYDAILAPPVLGLPLPDFLDAFVDALLACNRRYPGYLALSLASTVSAPLARALAELQEGVQGRLGAVLAARWPESTPEQRQLRGLVTYRIFIALLPLALASDEGRGRAIARELKTVLHRYLTPPEETDTAAPATMVADEER